MLPSGTFIPHPVTQLPRVFVLACLVSMPASIEAQSASGRAGAVPPECTYATCALRIEPGVFGRYLVRGADGQRVSRLRGFGAGVGILLGGPDSAAAHARRYVRNSRWAEALGVGAAVGLAVAAHRSRGGSVDRVFQDGRTALPAWTGVGLAFASVPFTLRAQRSLPRAIWWYNAALPR